MMISAPRVSSCSPCLRYPTGTSQSQPVTLSSSTSDDLLNSMLLQRSFSSSVVTIATLPNFPQHSACGFSSQPAVPFANILIYLDLQVQLQSHSSLIHDLFVDFHHPVQQSILRLVSSVDDHRASSGPLPTAAACQRYDSLTGRSEESPTIT